MNTQLIWWRRLRWPLLALLALAAVGLVVTWLVQLLGASPEPKKKKVMQEIALIKPPPPPPPPKTPPPKEEIQEKIDVPKPQEQPTQPTETPPPGPDLAVDATGSGSGDGFGLLGKKGGVDLVGSGIGGSRFAWYSGQVKERIQEAIARDKRLREVGEYQRVVHLWINGGGQVTRIELVGPSDNADLDSTLRAVLRALPPMREGPPADMPQPLRLRVSAR